MCGICGIISFNSDGVSENSIRQMMSIQKHRGPDDEGVFIEDNVGFGFVRLSILDLSPAGHQPMFSADDRYVIVYNGEIFNYIELREELKSNGYSFQSNTDTEVLLAAYQHWGEDCLNHLNGMWAFVIYDRKNKNIFVSRDRYGIKPLYYYKNENTFAFSSEITPLLNLLPGKPIPDNHSIFDYLVFNRTDQTERTFFSEIKKLQHGHNIWLKTGGNQRCDPSIERWYDLRERVEGSIGFSRDNEFRDIFSSAVGIRLRSDVPVGVCLSGGLDSSSIVSVLMQDFHKKELNTFSAVYNKGQHGDESDYIRLYADELKNMYYIRPTARTLLADIEIFARAHAEPIPSTYPYAQFKVMELAKNHVVVTLDGQGADELLAGYHYFFGYYFKDLLKKGNIGRLAAEMNHYKNIHKSMLGYKTFLYFLMPKLLRVHLRIMEKSYIEKEFYRHYSNDTKIGGELYGSVSLQDALLNHFEYKLEHLLKWEDRNSMWFSLEARVPFLDHRVVEKTLATKSELIIKNGMNKHILRRAMQGTLPDTIRMRKDKIGFGTPQDEWFRDEKFQKYISELIHSESFRSREIWNAATIKKMYRDHVSMKGNYAKEIWKWIHLENWYRMFID